LSEHLPKKQPPLADRVKTLAIDLGYTSCGIASVEPFVEFERAVHDRMKQFPEAAHLYEGMLKRVNPTASTPWARSIVVCVSRAGAYRLPEELVGYIGRNYLVDSRFQDSPDFTRKTKMKEGLIDLGMRVRKGGVPDRWAGARAGVTRFGRNCFAYSKHGSWINVETWRVDAELPADEPTLDLPCPDNCDACMKACPTGAIVEPYVMRMDRCIAYLTYRAPEPIHPALWEKMGTWIYGCDVCQQVCPLNKGKWEPLNDAPWLNEVAPRLTPQALSTMDDATYRSIVHPRFWYIPVDGLARWHRNAQRALEK